MPVEILKLWLLHSVKPVYLGLPTIYLGVLAIKQGVPAIYLPRFTNITIYLKCVDNVQMVHLPYTIHISIIHWRYTCNKQKMYLQYTGDTPRIDRACTYNIQCTYYMYTIIYVIIYVYYNICIL